MEKAINAIFPIFFILILGFFLKNSKQKENFKEDFWIGLEKLLFNILFPATLIGNIGASKIEQIVIFKMLLVLIVGIFIIFFICILIKKKLSINNEQFTSILQGSIRYNTYIFLSIAGSFFNNEKLMLAANLSAYMIIFMNIASIAMFNIYLNAGNIRLFIVLKNIFQSPMIIASILALLIREFNIEINQGILNSLIFLGNASFCIAYLIIGSALRFNMKDNIIFILIANFLKLIIFPLIVFLLLKIIILPKDAHNICILFSAVPTAANAQIMSRAFGGDYRLMSDIASVGLLSSLGTMFLIFWLFLQK
ncbi:MAG: AEC family transporter [Rickettsiales bacterium]